MGEKNFSNLSALLSRNLRRIQYNAKYEVYRSLFVPYLGNDFLTAFHRLSNVST